MVSPLRIAIHVLLRDNRTNLLPNLPNPEILMKTEVIQTKEYKTIPQIRQTR